MAFDVKELVSQTGIAFWHVRESTVPIVAIEFSFQGGRAADPEPLEGCAELLSTLFDEGAGRWNSTEFQARIKELAVRWQIEAGRDALFGSLQTVRWNLSGARELLAAALTEPHFDPAAVARMRAQLISAAEWRATRPDEIAEITSLKAAYGTHPYGRTGRGDATSLARLKPTDVRNLWRDIVHRQGLHVVIVGDIDPTTAIETVDAIFGALPPEGKDHTIARVSPTIQGRTLTVAHPTPQSSVRFAMPGVTRDDPDFLAAFILNHILGGGSFTSRLYLDVREKRGLAYSVSSYLSSTYRTGIIRGGAATRSDSVSDTVNAIRQTIHTLAETGPTEAEVRLAKDFLIGSYPLRFDSTQKIARQLLIYKHYGLGRDYMRTRDQKIRSVSLASVQRVARRLLGSEPDFVIVGPAASNESVTGPSSDSDSEGSKPDSGSVGGGGGGSGSATGAQPGSERP